MFTIDENTKALLHFNKENNLLKDECENIWIFHGDSLIYSNENPVMTHSAFFNCGTYLSIDNIDDFLPFSSDFTIECLFSLENTMTNDISKSNLFQFGNDILSVYFSSNLNNNFIFYPCIKCKDIVTDNKNAYIYEKNCYHIALTKNKNNIRLWLDGFLILDISYDFKLFGEFKLSDIKPNSFYGYISEFRISNICRYNKQFGKYYNNLNENIKQISFNNISNSNNRSIIFSPFFIIDDDNQTFNYSIFNQNINCDFIEEVMKYIELEFENLSPDNVVKPIDEFINISILDTNNSKEDILDNVKSDNDDLDNEEELEPDVPRYMAYRWF